MITLIYTHAFVLRSSSFIFCCLCFYFLYLVFVCFFFFFFFSSRRRHTRCSRDWSSDVCSSDLLRLIGPIVLDQGLDQRLELGRGQVAPGRLGARAPRLASDPDQLLGRRKARQIGGAAGLREAGDLLRLGHLGCALEHGKELGKRDLGRSLGEGQLDARHIVEGPSRQGGEPGRGSQPVIRTDRVEDLAIAGPLLRAEPRGNRLARTGGVFGEDRGRRQGEGRGQQK